jgi:pyridoxal phosphate enzyme (YggS family)
VVELISDLRAERIRQNLARVRERISDAARVAGRDPDAVEILAATKYVRSEDLPILTAGGIQLVGENRAQDLATRAGAYGEMFTWDFIGALQSRRVRTILPHVRLIHSVASTSALRELDRHRALARPELAILIEVNVAREPGKSGIPPEELDAYLEHAPVPVAGLMCMPPLASDPEDSRRWFAALRDLAAARDLPQLSMGTSQDYLVAVQEGATIVRIGTSLYY